MFCVNTSSVDYLSLILLLLVTLMIFVYEMTFPLSPVSLLFLNFLTFALSAFDYCLLHFLRYWCIIKGVIYMWLYSHWFLCCWQFFCLSDCDAVINFSGVADISVCWFLHCLGYIFLLVFVWYYGITLSVVSYFAPVNNFAFVAPLMCH